MADITDIERLNYYEGEYLGAIDFEAEQEYHRDMRPAWRHRRTLGHRHRAGRGAVPEWRTE